MKKNLVKLLLGLLLASCPVASYAVGTDATQTAVKTQSTFGISTLLKKVADSYQLRSGQILKQNLRNAGFKVKSTSKVRMWDGEASEYSRQVRGQLTVWSAPNITVNVKECPTNTEIDIVFGSSAAKEKFLKELTAAGWEKGDTYDSQTIYDGWPMVIVEGNKLSFSTAP